MPDKPLRFISFDATSKLHSTQPLLEFQLRLFLKQNAVKVIQVFAFFYVLSLIIVSL
jgi:hypothetical protein